jgi:ATP-binding cassette subfamily C (CFTR/MRP) protein 1
MLLSLPLTLRSGKSSLLLTLLRLLVLNYGIILVGDIDPQTLPRKLIRSRMIAIPQDPFILKMPLHQIIDPCLSVSDEPILEAPAKIQSGLSLRIVQGWTKT